jgi:antitoxin component YwqK of YwqJK toxin-antitoxin module
MFKIKVSIQAFIKGIIKSFFTVPYSNLRGAFFMTITFTAAIAGIISENSILFWIGIIADLFLLMVFLFSTVEDIKSEYYDLTSDIDKLPDGSHTINKRLSTKIKVTKVKGKIHGEYCEYYLGELEYSQIYSNGVKNGNYEKYYVPPSHIDSKKGIKRSLIESGSYKNAAPHGIFNTYYRDGLPLWSSRYSEIQIKSSTEYKDGLKHGFRKKYYSDGYLLDASGKPTLLTANVETNIVDFISFSSYYVNGVQEGEELLYEKNGQLVRESQIKDGNTLITKEYYPNGEIRMINKSNEYEFYSWDSDLNKSVKKCKININIIHKTQKYGPMEVTRRRFNETWTNFNSNGTIDYELKFTESDDTDSSQYWKEEKTAEKIVYDQSGKIITSNIIKCKLKKNSDLSFYPTYNESRSVANNGKYIYSYYTGVMGPPGVGTGRIEIGNITSLDDVLEIEDISNNETILHKQSILDDKTVEDLQINVIEKNNNKVKFCSKCGNNVENQKFCAKCGNKT